MVSLLVAVPAMKAEALTDATTPYTDTFDGSKGGNYTAHGIFWNGVNGKLNVGYNAAQPTINGGGWHYYYLKDLNWKNFTMEFDVENQASQFGVVVRAGESRSRSGPGRRLYHHERFELRHRRQADRLVFAGKNKH